MSNILANKNKIQQNAQGKYIISLPNTLLLQNLHAFALSESFCVLIYLLDSDDDEDITVHRKPHRNAIRDSDSEEEEAAADNSACMAEALVLSASSAEEMETDEAKEKGKGKARGAPKGKRISRAPVDSDNSEPEQEERGEMEEQQNEEGEVKSKKEQKKREKSRMHREKKEKRSKAVEKLKKKDRFSEVNEVSKTWIFFFSIHWLSLIGFV